MAVLQKVKQQMLFALCTMNKILEKRSDVIEPFFIVVLKRY